MHESFCYFKNRTLVILVSCVKSSALMTSTGIYTMPGILHALCQSCKGDVMEQFYVPRKLKLKNPRAGNWQAQDLGRVLSSFKEFLLSKNKKYY